MAVSPYRITPARIGNTSGLRLAAAFFRDHPQFIGIAGQPVIISIVAWEEHEQTSTIHSHYRTRWRRIHASLTVAGYGQPRLDYRRSASESD
jgi:hypothetical protein